MNQKDLKRGCFYWKDKKPYLSVTEILKVIDKPALRRWYGEQVYYAMLVNPGMQKEEALSAPYKVSSDAKSRGSTVHSIVEAYKHTGEHIDSIPEEFRGYAKAFYKFVEDLSPIILEHEKTVFSAKYNYGGTLDLIIKIGNSKPIVCDVKTGKDIYQEAWLQTAAYHEALIEEGMDIDGIAVLLLMEDGTYKFESRSNYKTKYRGFLACKAIYEALNEEMLTKVGYLNKSVQPMLEVVKND